MHPAPLWSVPHAWDGRTCVADLYQKIQALSSLQVQSLAHQDTDVDSHAGIEFSFCDCRGAWRVTVSGLGHGASWRMCPEASRLVVAHGQEPLVPHVKLLTGSSSACPAPGWALGLAREGIQP